MNRTTSRGANSWLLGMLLSLLSMPLLAQEFVWAPDFPVGASVVPIDAPDQNGQRRNFENLKGEKGLLFMLSRSFDW